MYQLSIIVPVYQVKDYLKECIDSIFNQTYNDWELIMIDDGSTDGSAEKCDGYACEKVKIIHQQNEGLSEARNRGLEIATGAYIGFIDSDDYILPNYFETLISFAEQYHADIVCSNIFVPKKKEHSIPRAPLLLDRYHAMKQLIIQNLYNHGVCVKLFRAEIAKSVRFLRGFTSEDVLFSYMTFKSADRILSIDYRGYVYRIHENSITTSRFSTKNFDLYKIMQRIKPDLEECFPELSTVFYDKFLYCKLYYLKKASELRNFPEYREEYHEIFKNLKREIIEFCKKKNTPLKMFFRFLPILMLPIRLLHRLPKNYLIRLNKAVSAIIHSSANYT